jgi:hypothetical protein
MISKIGLAGLKFNGKDTCAGIFQRMMLQKFEILHYADYLKESVSRIFNIDIEDINDTKKKEEPFINGPVCIDMFVIKMSLEYKLQLAYKGKFAKNIRELLQYVGTDYVRAVCPNYWTDHLDLTGKYWAVSDIRFSNEIEKVEAYNGINIWINRLGYPNKIDGHVSENSIHAGYCNIEIGVKENDFRIVKMLAKTLRYGNRKDIYKYNYNNIMYCLNHNFNITDSCKFLVCQPEFVKFIREYYAK